MSRLDGDGPHERAVGRTQRRRVLAGEEQAPCDAPVRMTGFELAATFGSIQAGSAALASLPNQLSDQSAWSEHEILPRMALYRASN